MISTPSLPSSAVGNCTVVGNGGRWREGRSLSRHADLRPRLPSRLPCRNRKQGSSLLVHFLLDVADKGFRRPPTWPEKHLADACIRVLTVYVSIVFCYPCRNRCARIIMFEVRGYGKAVFASVSSDPRARLPNLIDENPFKFKFLLGNSCFPTISIIIKHFPFLHILYKSQNPFTHWLTEHEISRTTEQIV